MRGPEVRTTTVRTLLADAPKSTMQELHRFGGTVSDGDGRPVSGAWIALPEAGRWAVSDGDGQLSLRAPVGRIAPGPGADGRRREAEATRVGAGREV